MATGNDRNNLNINVKITINDAIKELKDLVRELKGLGDSLKGLNVKVVNNNQTIDKSRTTYKNATKNVYDYSNTVNNTTKNIEKNNDVLNKNTLAFGALNIAVVKMMNSLKEIATASANSFIEFEKQLRNVNSLAQLGEKQFQGLATQITNLTNDPYIKEGATGLTKAMYQLVSSGFDTAEALEIAGVASKAASAGITSTETAVLGLAGIMNAYNQKTVQDSINYSDKMFKIVDKGVVSFEQLSNNLGTVVATASAANVSFDEIGAGFIALTRAGINVAEAETAINNLIRAIIDPSKQASDYAKTLGIELNAVALQSKGLEGIMQDVAKATGGNVDMIAKLIPEARAFKAAATLAKNETKGFAEALDFMKESAGASGRALSEQSKATSFSIEKLKQSFENLNNEIGKLVTEEANPFIDILKDIVKYISLLDDDTKKFLVQLGLWIVGIGSLTLAMSGLVFVFKPIVALIVSLAVTQLPALIAAWGSLISLLEGSVLLFGAGGTLALGLGGLVLVFGSLTAAIWTLKEAWDWWISATKAEMQWKEIENQVTNAKKVIMDYNKVLRTGDTSKLSITELKKYQKAFIEAISTSSKGEQEIYRREANLLQTQIESRKDYEAYKKEADKTNAKSIADKARLAAIEAEKLALLDKAKKEKAENDKKRLDEASRKQKEYYDKQFSLIEKEKELTKQQEIKGDLTPEKSLEKQIEYLNKESVLYNKISKDKLIIDESYKSDAVTKALQKQTEILKIQKDFTKDSIKEKLDMVKSANDRATDQLNLELKATAYTEKQKTNLIIEENKKKVANLKALLKIPGIDPELTEQINNDIYKLEQENQTKLLELKKRTSEQEKDLALDTTKFLIDTFKDLLQQDQQKVYQEQSLNKQKYDSNEKSFQDYIKDVEVLGEMEAGIYKDIADSEAYSYEERERARAAYTKTVLETQRQITDETREYLNNIFASLNQLSSSENKLMSFIGNISQSVNKAFNETNNLIDNAKKALSGDTSGIIGIVSTGLDYITNFFDRTGKAIDLMKQGFDGGQEGAERLLKSNEELTRSIPLIGDSIADLGRMWSDFLGVTISESTKKVIDEGKKAIETMSNLILDNLESTKAEIAKYTEDIASIAQKTNEKSYNAEKDALEKFYDDRLEIHKWLLKNQGKLNKEELEDRIKSERKALETIKKNREELLQGRKDDQEQAQKDYQAFQKALGSTKSGLGQDFYRSNALDVEANTGELTKKDLEIERQFKKGAISVSEYRAKQAEQSLLRYAYLENQLNNTVDPKERLEAQEELDGLMEKYFNLYRDSDLEALDRQEEKASKQLSDLEKAYDVEKGFVDSLQTQKLKDLDDLNNKYMDSSGVYKDYFVDATKNWIDYAKYNISGITDGLRAELSATSKEFNDMQSNAKRELAILENKQNFLKAGINANQQGTSLTKDPFSMSSYMGNNTTNNTSNRTYVNSPSVSVSGGNAFDWNMANDTIKRLTADFNRIAGK